LNRSERLKLFVTNIQKIVNEGKVGSYVIFNTSAEKFVQFAYDPDDDLLICDIPLPELSKEEKERLLVFEDFSKGDEAIEVDTSRLASFQTIFKGKEADKAGKLIERIFIKVFYLPSNYNPTVELQFGNPEEDM